MGRAVRTESHGQPSPPGYGQAMPSPPSALRRRTVRAAKRAGLAAVALVLAGALAFGLLMLVNAW